MQAHADSDFSGALKEEIPCNHGQFSPHIVFWMTSQILTSNIDFEILITNIDSNIDLKISITNIDHKDDGRTGSNLEYSTDNADNLNIYGTFDVSD